jgi:hypothetical protein
MKIKAKNEINAEYFGIMEMSDGSESPRLDSSSFGKFPLLTHPVVNNLPNWPPGCSGYEAPNANKNEFFKSLFYSLKTTGICHLMSNEQACLVLAQIRNRLKK